MSAPHTPGPWVSDSACGLYARNVTSSCGNLHVATVLTARPARRAEAARDDTEPTEYGAGNLALIAAAPDLLAIVERVEALLTRQKWLAEGDAPESVLLRDARDVLASVAGSAA